MGANPPEIIYIESRHQHLPAPVAPEVLRTPFAELFPRKIPLAGLKNLDWPSVRETMRLPEYSSTFPLFSTSAEASISVIKHPEDHYGSTDALEFKINAQAVTDLASSLSQNFALAARLFEKWELLDTAVYVIPQLPIAQIVSTLVPRSSARPEDFASDESEICEVISELWPFFIVLITQLDDFLPLDKRAYTLPENRFGLPDDLHACRHPDFDPSTEYQYHPNLFCLSAGQNPWIDSVLARSTFVRLAYSPMRDCTVWASETTTVYQFSNTVDLPILVKLALQTALHSDLFKLLSFSCRLYVALLEVSAKTKLNPKQVRQADYQQHIFFERMWQRSLLMDDFARNYFADMNKTSDFSFVLERMRFLSERTMKLAEGLETDQALEEDRRLQMFALFLGGITIFALIMDGYTFWFGSTNEDPPGKVTRTLIISALISALILLVIVLTKKLKRNALAGTKSRLE